MLQRFLLIEASIWKVPLGRLISIDIIRRSFFIAMSTNLVFAKVEDISIYPHKVCVTHTTFCSTQCVPKKTT